MTPDADRKAESNIYEHLAIHQRHEDWEGRPLVETLQQWANRFIVEFKLDIPEVVLRVERMPASCFGHFRCGHNGFGLRGEVAINSRHVGRSEELWRTLGVLLVQLLHGWQQAHGNPAKRGHHNAELREKAGSLGLLVNKKGLLGFAASSAFKNAVRAHGIEVPDDEIPIPAARPRGSSKQKKWSCGCPTNVRCAVAEFYAQCLKCGQVFRQVD